MSVPSKYEPICVPRTAKSFFIPVVHNLSGAVGHVAAPELPSQEDRAPSRGTHGSTGAPLSGRQSPELWDIWQHRSLPLRKAEPELWDTWQHRSSPLRKAELGAMGHVATPELTS
jgi:hypothetical protein